MTFGGGGGADTVDKAYNSRMATLAEQAAGWEQEYQNFYKYGVTYDPTESVSGYYDAAGNFQEVDPTTWKERPTSKGFGNIGKTYDPNYDPSQQIVTKTRGEIEGYDSSTPSYMQMETAQIGSNLQLIPEQTKQALAETSYATNTARTEEGLLPQYAKATGAAYDLAADRAISERSLIPQQTQVRSALNTETLSNITSRAPVTQKYYDETLKGIDVGERMNRASADVAGAFKDASATSIRNMSRYGINPNSGRGRSALSENSLAAARTEVGARTAAGDAAEAENYNRLAGAMALQPQQQAIY